MGCDNGSSPSCEFTLGILCGIVVHVRSVSQFYRPKPKTGPMKSCFCAYMNLL
jgi:hypothetical protein